MMSDKPGQVSTFLKARLRKGALIGIYTWDKNSKDAMGHFTIVGLDTLHIAHSVGANSARHPASPSRRRLESLFYFEKTHS